MQETYNVIIRNAEGLYKEKGSKFISKSYLVTSKVEAEEIVKALKKEFHDARHWCYAYVVGKNYEDYRINDDGEPSGTAGKPILGQINSNNLTNLLIVVIRYFGGVKLGTSGLIRAYKNASSSVLENSGLQTKEILKEIVIKYPFSRTKIVMQLIKKHNLKIKEQEFLESCKITFSINISKLQIIKDLFVKNLIEVADV